MNISIMTVFPQLYEPFIKTSLIGRAVEMFDSRFVRAASSLLGMTFISTFSEREAPAELNAQKAPVKTIRRMIPIR